MNSLIQPAISGTQSAVTCPLYDPREVRESRRRFERDLIPSLDYVSSICVPAGRWPSKGWFLLSRSDYDKLNTYATNLQLEIGDPKQSNNVATFNNLSIIQAQCVTRGLSADLNALYLIELTDGRGIVHNDWFKTSSTASYNIRAPSYPQTFHPGSMNGGTTWTWVTILQDMWNSINTASGSVLGTWPGFPSGVTISGTP